MDKLDVERLGGFAGFGGPSARIRSRGVCAMSDLSAKDRSSVEDLLAQKVKSAPNPDEFVYRITKRTANATSTVEVPESMVPQALKNCVKDELL
ncbi:hypothetical protein GCM10007881_60600 [Mesorhizobium huakuii]|uniref:protealysin inhibitor emfourin n=1 Tax=Mesorhizobium huakuii TaxID=28104 RepID=UPI00235BABCC|nr:protealysin inhibitor emfourin [Mesorhizobium huakuii]GLQ82537.1 hypothetical protein GCM10007881_60600 [Mesorhizobium huakuii]